MKKISSDFGNFFKYVYIVIYIVLFPLFWLVLQPSWYPQKLEMAVILSDIAVVATALFLYLFLWPIVDQVFDEGDTLLVKRRGTILRIPISEAESINQRFLDFRVLLNLKQSCRFGKKVIFFPALPISIPGIILALLKIEWIPVDQLRKRIERAKESDKSLVRHPIEIVSKSELNNLVVAPRLKKSKEMPEEIRGWNWGACLLTWIWGIGNRSFYTFFVFIPFFGYFIMTPLSGGLGNKWAWENRDWDSIEHFREKQRKWAHWGFGVWGAFFALLALLYLSS